MKEDRFRATRQFLNWMNSRYPGSRNKILSKANIPISRTYLEGLPSNFRGLEPGLGQFPSFPMLPGPSASPTLPQAYGSGIIQSTLPQPEPAWWEKIADAASDVAKGYLSYKQQDKLTDMQIERMKRGLPPVEDPGRYMAPTVKIAHEIDPAQLRRTLTPSKETQQLLWVGGGAIALILLMVLSNR